MSKTQTSFLLKILKALKEKSFLNKEKTFSFLAIIVFALFLALTGIYFSKSKKDLLQHEEQHVWIQNEFQNFLSDRIEKKHPEITGIVFHKVWTKASKTPEEIKIFFHYSLTSKGESGGTAHLKGSALLKEVQKQFWQIEDFTINQNLIDFSEPLVIKAKSDPNLSKPNPNDSSQKLRDTVF